MGMSFRLVQKSVTLNDLEWRNGQTTAKIMSIFRFFKMAATAILDFQILEILTPERSIWPNCVNVRQILSKSVKPRPRYGDFSILQDDDLRHLGFSNFRKF